MSSHSIQLPTLAECCELDECCRCCPNGYGDATILPGGKEACHALGYEPADECCICCPDVQT